MDTMTTQTSARVRQYIIDNFMYAHPNATLGDDDALLTRGIIDSLGVVELLTFVEEELGVHVPDHEITEANFGSVNAISAYVDRARAGD